jgi:phosphinothricin acetyltransferase
MDRRYHLHACDAARDGEAIRAIFNDAIAHTTALYDYAPRSAADIAAWFALCARRGDPVIGAFEADGTLAGFGSYGPFRERPANKYTVEHSVYVHPDHRGAGLGRGLLAALVEAATAQDYHVMIGAIDAANATSIALHRALGFRHAGTLSQVAFKFGRWLDLALYERVLPTPAAPQDG